MDYRLKEYQNLFIRKLRGFRGDQSKSIGSL